MKLSSPLSEIGIQVTVNPPLLIILLSLLLAVWLIFTVIIRYHWKNYGTGGVEILRMNIIYLLGSTMLIAFTLISFLLYVSTAN